MWSRPIGGFVSPGSVLRGLLALSLALASTACAPRFYDRSTLEFDAPDEDAVQVRYGELDGCLLRRQVPVEYTLRRPRYTLVIKPVAGLDSQPRIELRLRADASLELVFPGVEPPPAALFAEQGSRYLIDSAVLPGRLLHVEVHRGTEILGEERLRFSETHCRILSPTG